MVPFLCLYPYAYIKKDPGPATGEDHGGQRVQHRAPHLRDGREFQWDRCFRFIKILVRKALYMAEYKGWKVSKFFELFYWGSRNNGDRHFPNLRIPRNLWGVSTDTSSARDIRIVEVGGSTPLCSTIVGGLRNQASHFFFVSNSEQEKQLLGFVIDFKPLKYKAGSLSGCVRMTQLIDN